MSLFLETPLLLVYCVNSCDQTRSEGYNHHAPCPLGLYFHGAYHSSNHLFVDSRHVTGSVQREENKQTTSVLVAIHIVRNHCCKES